MNRFILCGVLLSAAACVPVSWAQMPLSPATSAWLPGEARHIPKAASGLASDPLDARSPVPVLNSRPSLGDYRPYKDAAVGQWRQLNDNVRDVGGWKTYARLSQEPDGIEGVSAAQRSASTPEQTEAPKAAGQKPASGAPAGHGH